MFASGFVLLGLTLAAKPADEDHPYGHGRVETLTGLLIGLVLTAGGALISWASMDRLGQPREPLAAFVIWPLVLSLVAKIGTGRDASSATARQLHSAALTADAWNDTMDTISAVAALVAVGLTLGDRVALRRGRPLRRLRGGADRDCGRRPRVARYRHATDGHDARRAADGRDSRRRP